MREIEVKARLRDEKLFLQKAKERGIIFGEPITQGDTAYQNGVPYSDPAWTIFRIRQQGDTAILTMKYAASSRLRDNHERESIIENPKEVHDMLYRIGYTDTVRVQKDRRIAHYNGLELCLDEVQDLGVFVEVEKLTDDAADVDAVQDELWRLLCDLGIDPDDRVSRGYDTLMREHLGKHQP